MVSLTGDQGSCRKFFNMVGKCLSDIAVVYEVWNPYSSDESDKLIFYIRCSPP